MINAHAQVGTTGAVNPHFFARGQRYENFLIDHIDRLRDAAESRRKPCQICKREAKALRAPLAVAA